jgi:hypothetical protein
VSDALDCALELEARLAEAKAVEQRHRACAHRDDVAQDPADACRRSLERLDRGGVVVALDLEGDRLAVTEIDHARVLAGTLEDALACGGQTLQEKRGVLVAAMLRPEQREDRELEAIRVAAEQLADTLQLPVGQPEGPVERLFRDRRQSLESSWGTRRSVPSFSQVVGFVRFPSR